MAIIYKVSYDNSLINIKHIFNEKTIIKSSAKQIDVSVDNRIIWNELDLAKLKAKCKANDIFNASREQVFQPHWHTDIEHRLIIQGSGRFYVPREDAVYIIECSVGDLLMINGGVVHWFYSEGIITAIRFFSENTSHISQTTDISEKAMGYFNEFGDNICTKI